MIHVVTRLGMTLTWMMGMPIVATACTGERRSPPSTGANAPAATTASAPPVSAASAEPALPLPAYLERLATDGDLYARARDGGAIVLAPAADIAVVRGYPQWKDKGPLSLPTAERLTIMTAKTSYAASEDVRVIHVHEVTKPDGELYVMGPKAIFGEYVDGVLASRGTFAPAESYDGVVVPSPGVDTNYEVSAYRLSRGTHEIQWRFATLSGPTVLRSNVLRVVVR